MVADTVSQCTEGRYILFVVAQIGRHFTEKLRKRHGIFRELHALVIIRPNADAPNIEPEHLVGDGLYRRCCGCASGTPPARKIRHIAAPATAQHQRGESVPSVWCHLPANARTAVAVHIDQRQLFRISGYLEIHEGMIGAITLAGFFLLHPTDEFTVVVCSRPLCGCTSYREVTLFDYCNRFLRSGYCCN